ncbi:MAG: hypothetical protein LBH05_04430, partial [Deferribacteraceae bacterium]|nr:hypothetical protein [Deferribacteraceae bacterium]
KVIHSPFSGQGKVCFDRNSNKKCDDNEPSANIASNGTFTITGSLTDVNSVALVAELTATVTASYSTLATPSLIFETPAGQRVVSSITTIIKAKMDQDLLSLGDASDAVKTDLGLGADDDLFDSAPTVAITTLTGKITEVVSAMFDKLFTRFGITISDRTIMLVMNEIIPQLAAIADGSKTTEEVVSDTVGSRSEADINSQMDALKNGQPEIMTVKAVLDKYNNTLNLYNFSINDNMYAMNGWRINSSSFSLAEWTSLNTLKSDNTLPATITESSPVTITSDGGILFNFYIPMKLSNFVITPLKGKRLKANSAFYWQEIGPFPENAVMYRGNYNKINITLDTLAELRKKRQGNSNNYPCWSNEGLKADVVTSVNREGNTINIGSYGGSGGDRINMNPSDRTFTWIPINRYLSWGSPFITEPIPNTSGSYTITGTGNDEIYTFTSTRGDIYLYYYEENTHCIAYYQVIDELYLVVFNDVAARYIRDNWNVNITP